MASQQFGISPKQVNELAYTGADINIVPVTAAQRDPAASDKNYPIECLWRNELTNDQWILVGFNSSGAIWMKFQFGSVSGPVSTLKGNTGAAVGPDGAANINVVGDGTTITIAGNPGTNTLTASVVGGLPPVQKFTGDDGTPRTPTANNFNILGATVANATNMKPVFVQGSAATETIDVQLTTTSTSGTKSINNAGLASFDSAAFSVDAGTGFISLSTSLVVIQFTTTGASNDPVVPLAGSVAVLGANGVTTDSTPNNNTITVSGIQATTAQIGVTTLASSAQAIAGTDAVNAVTSAALAAKLGTQTLHALPIGAGSTNPITWTAPPTNGQLLIGRTGLDPVLNTLTAGTGITIDGTSVPGSITITNTASAFTWQDRSTNLNPAVVSNGYVATAAINITLPNTPANGSTISFEVDTASALTITAGAADKIRIGNIITVAVGGNVQSTKQGDTLTIVYRSAGNVWIALSAIGNWSVT